MNIRGIHIDGFGIWHDRRWSALSEGLNVFHGPNEAGKTTLMSFVRSVLFGFERRSHPRRYEPLAGGDYGGWLEVSTPGGAVRVQRTGGRHVRGVVEVRPLAPMDSGRVSAGNDLQQAGGEQALERILGGTTRTLYHNVFAFGLEELEHFRTLEDSEVASHISGAGMGVGVKRWSRVWKDLEERRSKLFLPRGQNSTLNQALRELGCVREEMDATRQESDDYFRILEEREQLRIEIANLETQSRASQERIRHFQQVRDAEPHRARREALKRELEALERVDRFPSGGVDRLNLLFDHRRGIEADMDANRVGIDRLRRERGELTRTYTPQDLIRTSRAVESLRSLLPRRDASEEITAGAMARRDSVELERKRIEARQAAMSPPGPLAMVLLAVLAGVAAIWLDASGYPAGRWAVVGLVLALLGWYYSRIRSRRDLDADLAQCAERLGVAEERLERAEKERQRIANAIERLAGRSDFSHVDLERESLRVGELEETAERLRSIEDRLEVEDDQSQRHRDRLQEVDHQIQELLKAGGATSEAEFFRRSELFRRRNALVAELERTPSVEVKPPGEMSPISSDREYEDVVAENDRSVVRLKEARMEAGRLEERLTTLSRSEQRSRARLRGQSLMTQIDEASEKWAVLTLCRTLLKDTRQIYETERQPQVLKHASEFFRRMTGGRWLRVISPLDSGILVESPDGDRVGPENLSRGTAEQLYLAMRLALVREYSLHVAALPVVLDDIFVNFDPERTRASIDAVRELSATHQVLLFTCHPHLVRAVQEIVPEARLYPLQ